MFIELLPLLEGRTVIITAAKTKEGTLTVTVYPSPDGADKEPPVAMTPLCVSGSAEELDRELPGLLVGYTETIGGFRSNLLAIKAQVAEAAAETERARAAKAAKPKPAAAVAAPKTAAATAPAAQPRADLFAASLPVAAEVPQIEGGTKEASDGFDPRVVLPPQPAPPPPPAAPAAPRRRATPIRGNAVSTAPVPTAVAAPPAPLAPEDAEPIGLIAEEPETVVSPQTTVSGNGSLAGAISGGSNLWSDEEIEPVVDVPVVEGTEDDDCPF